MHPSFESEIQKRLTGNFMPLMASSGVTMCIPWWGRDSHSCAWCLAVMSGRPGSAWSSPLPCGLRNTPGDLCRRPGLLTAWRAQGTWACCKEAQGSNCVFQEAWIDFQQNLSGFLWTGLKSWRRSLLQDSHGQKHHKGQPKIRDEGFNSISQYQE